MSTTNSQTTTSNVTPDEYTGKQILYNLFALAPDIHYTDAADIADVSKEHARRNIKALSEGGVSGSNLKEALDVELQQALYSRMRELGYTEDSDGTAGTYQPSIKTELSQIEGFEEQTEAKEITPPNFGLEKQAIIANAMHAEPALDPHDIALIADSSTEYARSIMRKIENREISPRQLQEILDGDVQARITEFVEEHDLLAEQEVSEEYPPSRIPTEESAEPTTTADTRRDTGDPAQWTPEADVPVQFDTVAVTTPEAKLPILAARDRVLEESLKRVRVINAWLAPGERSYADAGRLAGSSTEHARRTYRQIENGDIPTSEIRANYDPDLINALLTLEAAHDQGQIDLDEQDLGQLAEVVASGAVPDGTITYLRTDTVESRLAAVETAPESTAQPASVSTAVASGRSERETSVSESTVPESYMAQEQIQEQPEAVVPASQIQQLLNLIETLREFSEIDPYENEQRDWVLDRLSNELKALLEEASVGVEELESE